MLSQEPPQRTLSWVSLRRTVTPCSRAKHWEGHEVAFDQSDPPLDLVEAAAEVHASLGEG